MGTADPTETEALLRRWHDAVARLAPTAERVRVDALGRRTLASWEEPHRVYHDRRHLQEVLVAFDLLRSSTPPRDAAQSAVGELALWYHDVVYDPLAPPGGNERDSGDLACEQLEQLGVGPDAAARVRGLVLSTAEHEGDDDPLMADVHDADLWVLGATSERFDEYCRDVRREYQEVADAHYRAARARILQALLERPGGVYRTETGRALREDPARANLRREITRLAQDA